MDTARTRAAVDGASYRHRSTLGGPRRAFGRRAASSVPRGGAAPDPAPGRELEANRELLAIQILRARHRAT